MQMWMEQAQLGGKTMHVSCINDAARRADQVMQRAEILRNLLVGAERPWRRLGSIKSLLLRREPACLPPFFCPCARENHNTSMHPTPLV